MVTVALLAMSGLIGMVVDFGWSYFMQKAAQSAADAAALSAANAAMDAITSGSTTYSDLGGHTAQVDCSSGLSDTRQSACQYAQQNGFSSGGDNGRQTVTVSADTTSPAPTAPGVNVRYWVTVRVTNTIPQLFSAVLGNTSATIAARSTAAIVDTVVQGAALALNRANDTGPHQGDTFNLESGSRIITDAANGKGIIISSSDPASGTNNSTASSTSAFTMTRGGLTPISGWPNPATGKGDGPFFSDPMRDLGQPPVTGATLNAYPVQSNGTDWSSCPGYPTCGPGVYFAASGGKATGAPLMISSNVSFAASGGSFGDYVFFGGLNISGSTVNMGPGRYVMAGVLNPTNSGPYDLSVSNGASVSGGTGLNAGQLVILTDSNYPGVSVFVQAVDTAIGGSANRLWSGLSFGQANLGTGSGSGGIQLYGLNTNYTLPSDTNAQNFKLQDFGPTVIWQDQRFSNVKYTSSGNVDSSCGSIESPCTNSMTVDPKLTIGPTQILNLHGVLYQPRGAWMQVLGSTRLMGPLQMISGAFDIGASSLVYLLDPGTDFASGTLPAPAPLKMRVVALIE